MHINFNASPEDAALIDKIVDRAEGIYTRQSAPFDRMSVEMDITATHLNGCPLRLQKFLDADDFNFAHDLVGIINHVDRSTGQLTRHFLPRCSA